MGIFDHFPPQDVVIVHAPGTAVEERISTKATVVQDSAFFAVHEHVYEGDIVETPDPRGGVLRRYVKKVDINQSPFDNDLDHLEAHL
ncbi:hypothetical protein [Humibacter sp. RRB41]|uniref:hypothetical protein n=1 Tax=Humibacter sp. RRB41 TaxID=2919946 RepID=UPI001FAA30A6|nr:hypothetical protein [Humibacter sp. RRB41]